MLSSTATLILGDSLVSIDALRTLTSTISKLHHGLVLSDLNPRDHQNFASCQKICREEVLQGLKHVNDSNGTYIYLTILRSIIDAYYEKNTPFLRRIYLASFAVFIVRIWLTWIQVTTMKELDDTLTTLTQHWDIP